MVFLIQTLRGCVMEWLALISQFLLPALLKCFETTSMEDPQEYLRENFNSSTGKFDRDVVRDAIPATRRAVRQARLSASPKERRAFPRYRRSDLYELAERSLVAAMNAQPERVAELRAAAAGLPDDD